MIENDLRYWLDVVFARIRIASEADYESFKKNAVDISPDENDWPFFALALKEDCGVWSNEKRLKNQSRVKVFSTSELARVLK